MSQQPVRPSAAVRRAVINGFEFAAAGSTQRGEIPLGVFERLRDLLASDSGSAEYEVSGVCDAHGRLGLQVRVQAKLQLRCQRCLEAMPFEAASQTTLVLVATHEEIDAEPGGVDAPDKVVAGHEMPLAELVEDELILAVPFAPRHAQCRPAARLNEGEDAQDSPFAGLKGLLRKH